MHRLWFITPVWLCSWLDWRRWWHLRKQVAIVIQTRSLYSNLSLPSSVNKKLQRDKHRAGKLIQGSHCESEMRVRSPPLSSPQPDGNSRLWHCHNFASLLLHPCSSPFISNQGGGGWEGGNWSYCMWHTRERRGKKKKIALLHKAECHWSRMRCISCCLITVELFKIEAAAEYFWIYI